MKIGTPIIPPSTPRDQPYICPHCQAVFVSFRDPIDSVYTRPAIAQRLTVDSARLTCGKYSCWDQEVNAHSECRIAFFQQYRKAKTPQPSKDSHDDY